MSVSNMANLLRVQPSSAVTGSVNCEPNDRFEEQYSAATINEIDKEIDIDGCRSCQLSHRQSDKIIRKLSFSQWIDLLPTVIGPIAG